MENGDDWLANDKLQHFLLCFFLTFLFSFFASRFSLLRRRRLSIGCILSLTVGAAKEFADELGFFNSAGASVKDAVADILGVLVAAIALYFWNSICSRNRSDLNRGFDIV
ncbi:uncharacterized protein [Rutidosis leptorrhynchoides]|uniref:uncharacterized protein n=1 Tax=Rutidosis leptorrhynchoides TaxID=125765 RepID=UPI003A98D14A